MAENTFHGIMNAVPSEDGYKTDECVGYIERRENGTIAKIIVAGHIPVEVRGSVAPEPYNRSDGPVDPDTGQRDHYDPKPIIRVVSTNQVEEKFEGDNLEFSEYDGMLTIGDGLKDLAVYGKGQWVYARFENK